MATRVSGGLRGPAIEFPRRRICRPTLPPGRILANRRVLLVEEGLVIALDAEDILSRIGADAVTTAATIEAALEFIDEQSPALA